MFFHKVQLNTCRLHCGFMETIRIYAFPFLKNVFPRNKRSPDPYLKMEKCLNQGNTWKYWKGPKFKGYSY